MSFRPYRTLALIPDDLPLSWEHLQAALPPSLDAVWAEGDPLKPLLFGTYTFTFSIEAGEDVQEENAEILEGLGLGTHGFARRVVYSGEADDEMLHFNDHVLLTEALERAFPGVVLFDPELGERI